MFKLKIIVMIPTYNERENIGKIINKILNLKIKNLEILVVDDNSPDGTWEIVEEIARKKKKVKLLLRKKKKGRGYAGKAGYKRCLELGADVIIEMDGDFSHDPKYIPRMLDETKKYDVVLGSRMVKGGIEYGRNIIRRAITLFANFYTRHLLGINVRDCNSGFRCFRREALESINVGSLKSAGPSIVQEVLLKANQKRLRMKEIPIIFRNRTKGESKLGLRELVRSYFYITLLRLRK